MAAKNAGEKEYKSQNWIFLKAHWLSRGKGILRPFFLKDRFLVQAEGPWGRIFLVTDALDTDLRFFVVIKISSKNAECDRYLPYEY